MPFQLEDNILQTSTSGGTGAMTLIASAVGYNDFVDKVSDGSQVYYVIWNDTEFEVGLGTFNSGPDVLIRDDVYRSSNADTFVSFAGGGTHNIGCCLPGLVATSLYDPQDSDGILVRRSSGSPKIHVRRTLQGGTHIGFTNGDGDIGNPTIDDSQLDVKFARLDITNTFAVGQTFTGVVRHDSDRSRFSSVETTPFEHIFRADNLDADMILRMLRNGVDDYDLFQRVSAAWVRIAHLNDLTAGASGVVDAKLVRGFDWGLAANKDDAGGNGFRKMPDGFEIKWGIKTSILQDDSVTVTYASESAGAAFGVRSLNVQATPRTTLANNNVNGFAVRGEGASGFIIENRYEQTIDVSWMSIGLN